MAADVATAPSSGAGGGGFGEGGGASSVPGPSAAPNSQTPGHPSFRSERGESTQDASPPPADSPGAYTLATVPSIRAAAATQGLPSSNNEDQTVQLAGPNGTYAQFMKPKFARAPIKEAGRVAYLGESSNLSLLVHDRNGTTDVVHYPLPENAKGSRSGLNDLDNLEIDILHQRGAFLLPPRALCDELVESYFRWVAPVVPVINRSRFMRRYRDSKNPPSLLLLQAVLLAGSRVCTNPQLMDANGSTTPAAMTFYKRAKALYDANYEDDRVTIVQALILMGWYWEGPEDVTKNVFYWSRVAIIVAQGSGMHRSVEGSQLSKADKRLWKRIWWTLFTRDRSVAVALGRPVSINTDDADVGMVSEDDFNEDEESGPSEYPADILHVQFFLQYVKLCEIMGLVLSQQYSVASKSRRTNAIDLTHSDMALADWLQNCPQEVHWEKSKHHFWAALLHSNYYTTLCLLHRAHMPPATSQPRPPLNGPADEANYPSKNIAFQAAFMITSIVDTLSKHGELRFCPAFIRIRSVYSLFSALIMHVYQMRSSVASVVSATQERLQVCMTALNDVSKVWLVAKMVHTLFESILGNKNLEDKLQKAAGRRHSKNKQASGSKKEDVSKRKFDDMELGFSNGPPAPQVSYERSRPQTPAVTPSRELGHPPNQGHMAAPSSAVSPHMRQATDSFMGNSQSRSNTRPPTPFNPSFSIPPTPPDLYLVTRNSPPISQNMWENFQPDQLFPESAHNLALNQVSPPTTASLDPLLAQQMGQMNQHPPGMQQPMMPGGGHTTQLPQRSVRSHSGGSPMNSLQGMPAPQGMQGLPNMGHAWPNQFESMDLAAGSPEDSWSNSSKGPVVPTTLNVEDWFQFFGIHGDLSGMNSEQVF
ncbi:MAG: Transcriptional activator of fatty acid utilization [Sclerophora amabilis]|nr:MAG: Transcriptional activator of fatty acid utilization [Sclerophora amabilis]